jgi:hypothetical protein
MSDEIDLDALLEESVVLSTKTKQLKAQQKASNKGKPIASNGAAANIGFMNAAERAEHDADIARFKARAEGWVRTEVVLLAHAQICSHCGAEHHHIEGTFIKKWNEKLRISNLVKPDGAYEYEGLQKRVEIRTQQVSICLACHTEQGWADAIEDII